MTALASVKMTDQRFPAVLLWLSAGLALYLLLCPAAFQRRALMARLQRETAERDELRRSVDEHQARVEAMEHDPAVVGQEARKLGYGRVGESAYPLTQAELLAARRATAAAAAIPRPWYLDAVRQSIGTVIMLLLLGLLAALFFYNLRVDAPAGDINLLPPSGNGGDIILFPPSGKRFVSPEHGSRHGDNS